MTKEAQSLFDPSHFQTSNGKETGIMSTKHYARTRTRKECDLSETYLPQLAEHYQHKEIADAIGVSPTAIGSWLSGKHTCPAWLIPASRDVASRLLGEKTSSSSLFLVSLPSTRADHFQEYLKLLGGKVVTEINTRYL